MPDGSDVDSLGGILRPSLLSRPDDGAEEAVDRNCPRIYLLSKRSTPPFAGDQAETSWLVNATGEQAARRDVAEAHLGVALDALGAAVRREGHDRRVVARGGLEGRDLRLLVREARHELAEELLEARQVEDALERRGGGGGISGF